MFMIPTSPTMLLRTRKRVLASAFSVVLGAAFLGGLTSSAQAQTLVVPSALTTTEGNIANNLTEDLTEQQLISASLLSSIPVGASITGVAFRFDSSQSAINSAITFTNFDIHIGGSNVSALAVGQSFAANEASNTILARSGSLTFAANAFPSGGSPNAFGPTIAFSTPYTYTGGSLLFTFSATEPNTTFALNADATSTSAGNDYMQALSYNATSSTLRQNSTSIIPEFQYSVGFAASAPEPGSLTLLALSALPVAGMMIARRRKRRD